MAARQVQPASVAIVGAGILGTALARHLAKRNVKTVIIEKNRNVAAAPASAGNSGLWHTGYDAPQNSLEKTLLKRALMLREPLLREFGFLQNVHYKRNGALIVAFNQKQMDQLKDVVQENARAGDLGVRLLSRLELKQREPNLSASALSAVLCPHEWTIEPWLLSLGYAAAAEKHGATFRLGEKVCRVQRDGGLWRLFTQPSEDYVPLRSRGGELLCPPPPPNPMVDHQSEAFETGEVRANVVVNCGGLYGDVIEDLRCAGNKSLDFTVKPRKGQFLVFLPADGGAPLHILEPPPSQTSKGVILWTTVHGLVVVGPTATDQEDRRDRSTDVETLQSLYEHAISVFPALKHARVVGSYAGLRPATQYRDYQIGVTESSAWVTVCGVRSTGLSASAAIGEYITEEYVLPLLGQKKVLISGFEVAAGIGISDAIARPTVDIAGPREDLPQTELPDLRELSREFMQSGDETLSLWGQRKKVEHALSSLGFEHHAAAQTSALHSSSHVPSPAPHPPADGLRQRLLATQTFPGEYHFRFIAPSDKFDALPTLRKIFGSSGQVRVVRTSRSRKWASIHVIEQVESVDVVFARYEAVHRAVPGIRAL